jgi:hypothetical protein
MGMAFAEDCFAIPGKTGYGFFPLHSRISYLCISNTKLPDKILPGDRKTS